MAEVVVLTLTMKMRGNGPGFALWEEQEVVDAVVSAIEEDDPRIEVIMASVGQRAPVRWVDAPRGNPPGPGWRLVDGEYLYSSEWLNEEVHDAGV